MDSTISSRYYTFLDLFEKEEFVKECIESYKELSIKLNNSSNRLGAGHTRKVYSLNSDYVVKVPFAHEVDRVRLSVAANLTEYLITKRIKSHFVPCEMYFYKGLPVLVAEKIVPVYGPNDSVKHSELPEILHNLWDGFQVGLDKNENVVCYDSGCEDGFLENFPKDMQDFTEEEFSKLMSFSPSFILE